MRITRTVVLSIAVLLLSAPLARAQSFLERLEKSLRGAVTNPEDADKPGEADVEEAIPERPGQLGLVGDDFGEEGKGVRVLEVRPGGAAELAGIQARDLITEINDRPVRSLDDMADALEEHGQRGADAKLRITFERDGDRQTKELKLAPPPDELIPEPPARSGKSDPRTKSSADAAVSQRPSLGVTVVPLTEEARRTLDITVRQGVLIESIRPGSPADRAGLPIGGVIVALDGRRIDRPDDLIAAVRGGTAGQPVEVSYYNANRLFRKTVRLSGELPPARRPLPDAPPEARADDPRSALRGEDRPVLRGLGRALDALGRNQGLESAIGGGPASEEVTLLRQQVLDMQEQIDRLQRRLAELEARLDDEQ